MLSGQLHAEPISVVSRGQAGISTDSPSSPPATGLGPAGRRRLRAGGTMNTTGRRRRTSDRPARGRPSARALRPAIGLAVAALAASGLAACGSAGASSGPVTLNFYLYPDSSGATQQAIN